MRATLTGLHAETGGGAEPDVRALTRELLEGEVEAPTADVRWLISQDVDPDAFYAKEIAPGWKLAGRTVSNWSTAVFLLPLIR